MTWTSGPCEPATDETTARDRLIMKIAVAASATHAEAVEVVDWLQANPEVLRALAAVPTADVAEELAEWRAYDDAMRKRCLETMDPLLIENTLKNLANNLYHLRTRLAAAPEGVDAAEFPADELRCQETNTATEGVSHNRDMADTREIPTDELRQRLRQALGIDDSVNVDDDGLIKDVEDWVRSAHALAPAPVPAAPEGVDAADELAEALDNARYASELDENTLYETVRVLAAGVRERQETFATELARGMRHPRLVICPARVHSSFLIDSDDMVSCPWCPADEPDGMGLEAQGQMTDELAEAEAICREWLPFGRDGEAIFRVMAEYDRRGEALRFALAAHERVTKRADETYEAVVQRDEELGRVRELAEKIRDAESLGAAPEGVDAAEIPHVTDSPDEPIDSWGPTWPAREGVDAADERRQLVDLVKLGEEKQRLLADQLDAAQAAIGRVRDELEKPGMTLTPGTTEYVAKDSVLRALDDDTTEES